MLPPEAAMSPPPPVANRDCVTATRTPAVEASVGPTFTSAAAAAAALVRCMVFDLESTRPKVVVQLCAIRVFVVVCPLGRVCQYCGSGGGTGGARVTGAFCARRITRHHVSTACV